MRLKTTYAVMTLVLALGIAAACSNSGGGGGGGGGLFGGGATQSNVGTLHTVKPGVATPTSIFGLWKVGETDQGGVISSTLAKVEQKRLIIETRCTVKASRTVVIAQITVPVRISDEYIVIEETKKDSKPLQVGAQAMSCEAEIEGESYAYLLRDGQVFTSVGGAEFDRVFESKISD